MLQSIKHLYGDKLGASDGEIGHVKDFLFDDQNWTVRYVAVDTGSWLTGRQVLISPHAISRPGVVEKVLQVKLTRKQIEKSPSLTSHQPVSRQYEEEYHRYYGWPGFWPGDAVGGGGGPTILGTPPIPLPAVPQPGYADAHLRSTQAVNGYQLATSEGAVGHVCDFMIDDQNWAISALVIKIGHRFTGKEVLVSAGKVVRISYPDSTVFVDLTREAVEQSPVHDLTPVGEVR